MSIPYFNPAEFGEVLQFGSALVPGIWGNGFSEEGFMTGSKPEFVCRQADAVGVKRGTSVIRDGVTYKVREIEKDGTGFQILRLEKQ